jgi:hypothetical protein
MPATGSASSLPAGVRVAERSSAMAGSWRARGQWQPAAIDDQRAAVGEQQWRQYFIARLAIVRHVVQQELMPTFIAALQSRALSSALPALKAVTSARFCSARCHCQRPRSMKATTASNVSAIMPRRPTSGRAPAGGHRDKPLYGALPPRFRQGRLEENGACANRAHCAVAGVIRAADDCLAHRPDLTPWRRILAQSLPPRPIAPQA